MKKGAKLKLRREKSNKINIGVDDSTVYAESVTRKSSNRFMCVRPQKRNTQNGITLVALVITIIVMLLLSVVSINIMQNTGIIEKVKPSKEEHRASTIQEQKELFEKEIEISKYNGDTPKTINDLLDKLEEQKLITEEEKSTIIETGRITIGSKEIIFDKIILPEGYTRCEYLESTGTQYIDTEILPTNNTGINIDFCAIEYADKLDNGQYTCTVFGGETAWQNASFDFQAGLYGLVYNTTKVGTVYNTATLNDRNTNKHNLKIINQQYYFDDAFQYDLSKINTTEWKSNSSIILFGIKRNSNIQRLDSSKIYSCKIYNKENLTINLIPVIDENNVAYLYDIISGKTFYNQGTGEFIAGPIVE